MARKKKPPAHENHERWLVSYADFITLLFAFFVVMFASSQTDRGKASQISDSVKRALQEGQIASALAGILGGTPDDKGKGNAMMKGPGGAKRSASERDATMKMAELLPSEHFLNEELKAEIASGKLKVHMEARGLIISLRESAFYHSGDDGVSAEASPTIKKIALAIAKIPNPVRLEGHTDSVPIHNSRFRSNWELSAARAIAMLELLATRFGVPREKMAVAGYAEMAPVDTNDTEEGRAHNRRVDVVILNERGMVNEPNSIGAGHPAPQNPTKH